MSDANVWAVLRLRSGIGMNGGSRDTLDMLRLNRANHLTLIPADESHRGMVKRVEHFITYGEPSVELVEELLRNRGRVTGNKPLTEEALQEACGMGFSELAQKLVDGEVRMNDLEGIKPLFRLSPPQKGLRSVKLHFNAGGDLGYRGEAINDLVRRMM